MTSSWDALDTFFASLDEHPDEAASPPSSPALSMEDAIAQLGGAAPSSPASDDEELAFHALFGPDPMWEAEEEDPEEARAEDLLARLKAADAAASALEGEAGVLVERCPRKDPNAALEVELVGDAGPVSRAIVELRREAQAGYLARRSNASGVARFEGLAPGAAHELRVLGQASWSVESTEALPEDRATSAFDATWAPEPEASGGGRARVARGDCLWTIGQRHGLDAEALWDANPDLHVEERGPNILAVDDVVDLSKVTPTVASVTAGDRVRVQCEPAEARARLRFQDDAGEARGGIDFVLRVVARSGAEVVVTGTLDGDGAFDEVMPPDAVTMEVTLATEPDAEVYHFDFAHLDPLETVAGVQGRLVNLGFWCGDERGEVGPLTRRALRDFQRQHDLTESGAIDDATREKLATLYTP